MFEYDVYVIMMMLRVAMYMINEMMFCHVTIIPACVSFALWMMFWEVEIKLLNDESMHLHNYVTVGLYAQSDGGAFAQSDGEAY